MTCDIYILSRPLLRSFKDCAREKMPRKRRPTDWKQKCREAYEEGGRGIGKMLAYHPEREPDVWAWVGGLKIWPRYYLGRFVTFWRQENKTEAGTLQRRRRRRTLRLEEQNREMLKAIEETRRRFGHNRD